MVFKMLKGFSRLILTTVVLCSVGLFLCGSEVKAEDPITVSRLYVECPDTASEVTVKYDYKNTESTPATFSNAKVTLTMQIGSGTSFNTDPIDVTETKKAEPGQSIEILKVDKSKLLTYAINKATSTGDIVITNVKVTADAPMTETLETASVKLGAVHKITLQEAIEVGNYKTAAAGTVSTFTIGGRDYKKTMGDHVGYGIKGEKIVIKTTGADNYYRCIGKGTEKWYELGADGNPKFKNSSEDYGGEIGEADETLKIQYFPKATVTVTSSDNTIYLNASGTYADKIEVPYTVAAASGDAKDKTIIDNNVKVIPALTIPADGNIVATSWAGTEGASKGYISFTGNVLSSTASAGKATISAAAKYSDGTTTGDSPLALTVSGTINLTVYPALTDITFSPTSVYLLKNSSQNVTITPVPAGADPAIWERVGTANVKMSYDDSKKIIDQTSSKIGNISGKNGFVIASSKKTGTATAYIEFVVPETKATIKKSISVTVAEDTSLDADKTAKAINGSDKNYITVGYELDLASLVNNNLLTGEGKSIPKADRPSLEYVVWDDDDAASKYVESYKSMTDDASKPSKKLKGKAEGAVTFSAILDDGSEIPEITVTVYPMPSVSYEASTHKVTATIPAKVSTGYGDTDTNLNSGKGFKLAMEDTSNNTLYEYDKTKYQTAISSVGTYKTTYAIAAADIEAMVTNAATNGKFGGDTQVKFKVIPMGYKQGTSSEIASAKDEVNAKTDAAQVYQLSSKGTNFADSYAYGLDGMTVNLTASPNTGFTFSKWTDGVTSNPRSVKVAASGTRAFTPESVESAAAAAAGGDASQLYDDVPKTAESNAAIWLIVFMVFAVMGTAYALYLQLRAATSKNGK